MKVRPDLQLLLVQMRHEKDKLSLELEDFARFSGVDQLQFDTYNLYDDISFDTKQLTNYDAIFFGGSSGEGNVLLQATLPRYVQIGADILQTASDQSIPLFASCFGFQLAVVTFGGQLEEKADYAEMGGYELYLTEPAATDIVFRAMPSPFYAISGHEKSATMLPSKAELLVYSERCPYHAFRIEGKPFYATQFHPELDRDAYIKAITIYKDVYFKSDAAYKQAIRDVHATDQANTLIASFIDNIVLQNYE